MQFLGGVKKKAAKNATEVDNGLFEANVAATAAETG